MKIAIGADHRGFEYKKVIQDAIREKNNTAISWIDCGTYDAERTDYPRYAKKVCETMCEGKAEAGVLLCGSGIGMAIAANRYPTIFAALAWNKDSAQLAKEQDKANILVLPSDFISLEQAIAMVNMWLQSDFKDGRYQKRIDMINDLFK